MSQGQVTGCTVGGDTGLFLSLLFVGVPVRSRFPLRFPVVSSFPLVSHAYLVLSVLVVLPSWFSSFVILFSCNIIFNHLFLYLLLLSFHILVYFYHISTDVFFIYLFHYLLLSPTDSCPPPRPTYMGSDLHIPIIIVVSASKSLPPPSRLPRPDAPYASATSTTDVNPTDVLAIHNQSIRTTQK